MQSVKGNNSLLDHYFDDHTMSIHFKANCPILRKKGRPGKWDSEIGKDIVSNAELEHIYHELMQEVQEKEQSWLEIDRKYSKVLQI